VEWLGASTDIQELRALQDRLRVLLHELQHRVRNTLAVVRSIAASTGATSETVEGFAAHLDGRLNALARTQLVLTRTAGAGVDLETMIRDELLSQAAREELIELEGPPVRLSPKAAEVLTLAVHELTTNAVKYGALGALGGRVAVRWSLSERERVSWLTLVWQETGTSVATAAPRRQGFGTELIEVRVPYELGGSGALQFRPGGVRCEIELPLTAGESILQTDAPVEAVAQEG
jgi:two-component sensor histidine kinase